MGFNSGFKGLNSRPWSTRACRYNYTHASFRQWVGTSGSPDAPAV